MGPAGRTRSTDGSELTGPGPSRVGRRVGGNPSRVRISYPPYLPSKVDEGPDRNPVGALVVGRTSVAPASLPGPCTPRVPLIVLRVPLLGAAREFLEED
jgi:hypothetical protein